MRASRKWSRIFPALFCLVLLGSVWWSIAFGVESWPYSAYPMYSRPKQVDDVAVIRFEFTLQSGEVVRWKPQYGYIGRDLFHFLRRWLGKPGFESQARRVIRDVLLEVANEDQISDPSEIESVSLVLLSVDPAPQGFAIKSRLIFSARTQDLR